MQRPFAAEHGCGRKNERKHEECEDGLQRGWPDIQKEISN